MALRGRAVVRYTIKPGHAVRERSRSSNGILPAGWPGTGRPLRWAGGAARPRGSHTLAEAGEGRASLVSRYQPELIGTQVLLAPYIKRWLRRQRRVDMQTLKASLEAGAPS